MSLSKMAPFKTKSMHILLDIEENVLIKSLHKQPGIFNLMIFSEQLFLVEVPCLVTETVIGFLHIK